jgi:hypothetical protein
LLFIALIGAFWYVLPKTAVDPVLEINTTRPATTATPTPRSRDEAIQKALAYARRDNKPIGGRLVEANMEAITITAALEPYDVAMSRLGSFANAGFDGSNIIHPSFRSEIIWFVHLQGRWQPYGETAEMIEPSRYVAVLINPNTGRIVGAGSSTVPFLDKINLGEETVFETTPTPLDEIAFDEETVLEVTPTPSVGTSDQPQTDFEAVIKQVTVLGERRQVFLSSQSGWFYTAVQEYQPLISQGEGASFLATFSTEQMVSETWYHALADGSADQVIYRYTNADDLVVALSIFIDGYNVNFFGDTMDQARKPLWSVRKVMLLMQRRLVL